MGARVGLRGVRNDCTTLSATRWVDLGRVTLPAVIFVLSRRRSNWSGFGLHFLLSSWSWPCRSQTTRSGWLFARRSFSLRARRPPLLPRALTAWPLLFSGPREVASQLPGPSACSLGWPLRLGAVVTAPSTPRVTTRFQPSLSRAASVASPAWLVLPTGPRQVFPLLPGLVTSLWQKRWSIERLLGGGGTAT